MSLPHFARQAMPLMQSVFSGLAKHALLAAPQPLASSAKQGPLMAKHAPLVQGRQGGSSVKPGNVSSVVASKISDQWLPAQLLLDVVEGASDAGERGVAKDTGDGEP